MVISVALLASGCVAIGPKTIQPPEKNQVVRDQLIVHCDFHLPVKHRLLEDLAAERNEMADKLKMTTSDEPINIYLFESGKKYESYMRHHHPEFPDRRAFFVKSDTSLKVYAHWGERVAEDLRHEVAHGYLHAVIPYLPLWLDEGLAEYFEVMRGRHGVNRDHIELLEKRRANGTWAPNLARLETLYYADEMTQLDYAESWLWVHMLLETTAARKELLQHQLARLRIAGEATPLSDKLASIEESPAAMVSFHLEQLVKLPL